MTVGPKMQSALRTLGYAIESEPDWFNTERGQDPPLLWLSKAPGKTISIGGRFATEDEAFRQARDHAKGAGAKLTMADKVRFLYEQDLPGLVIRAIDIYRRPNDGEWSCHAHTTQVEPDAAFTSDEYGEGDSPEAAVDALWAKVCGGQE